MKVVKHSRPERLKTPSFICDEPLAKHLDKCELTKLLNKTLLILLLGKPGSGKSHLMLTMLQSPSLYGHVFTRIFVCMPENSRNSIKDNPFEELPEGQVFGGVSVSILEHIEAACVEDAAEGLNTILVLDDVQKSLKSAECTKKLLDMFNNRRHLHLTIILCCQNYKSIPMQIRLNITTLFIFKVAKKEMGNIFEELIEARQDSFKELLAKYLFKQPHQFCFVDTNSQRIFSGFENEIVFAEDEE